MKLTDRLLQCVLLVLLSCCALLETTKLSNEKTLNDALKKYCNGQLYIHSEYILKNLLIDERFAQMIFPDSFTCLSQLVDYLSLLCDTSSTGFTLEHFVSKLEGLDIDAIIKDSVAYGQDYIRLEREYFSIKNVLGIQKNEDKVTRKHIIAKFVTDFKKYYKLSDKNKLKKYSTKIMHKNRLKMAMFLLLRDAPEKTEPDKQDENNKPQGANNGAEEVKPPVKDPPKKSKTCCGLGWFKLLLGGGTFGVAFTSGLFVVYARFKYWPEWAWGPAPFTTSSSSVHMLQQLPLFLIIIITCTSHTAQLSQVDRGSVGLNRNCRQYRTVLSNAPFQGKPRLDLARKSHEKEEAQQKEGQQRFFVFSYTRNESSREEA